MGTSGWLDAHDPGRQALRRSVRVTVAACLGFYLCRYLLGDATMAVYACFGAIALGVLSQVTGKPGQRTRTYAAAWLVGIVLVTAGTLLAGSTWAASLGMLVVAFVVAYSAVGGPRLVGLANGLQLLYILPSFPPYDPGLLSSRLLGLTLGVALLTVLDRVLLAPAAPFDLVPRLATATGALAAYLDGLLPLMHGEAGSVDAARTAAVTAVQRSRPSLLAPADRPSGPSRHDRALFQCASSVRSLLGVTERLQHTLQGGEGPARRRRGDRLLQAAAGTVRDCERALSHRADDPDLARLEAADQQYATDRRRWLADVVAHDHATDDRLALGAVLADVGDATRVLVLATRALLGAPLPGSGPAEDRFWYAHASTRTLWITRLRGQLSLRSVYLQNAIRLGVALTLARVVAGELDFSHGFWVLLATLTLLRTTASATRLALAPALVGTIVGAALAAVLLVAVGPHTLAFAFTLPALLLLAFVGGALLGPAVGQFGFTLVVTALFAQVAAADWHLAEARLLDVAVGGAIGVVVGVLAWPAGAGGQMAHAAGASLRAAGAYLGRTTAYLTGSLGPGADSDADAVERVARHRLFQAGEVFSQLLAESGRTPAADWNRVLDVSRHILRAGPGLRTRYPGPGPLPWPDAAELLDRLGTDTLERVELLARQLPAPGPPPELPAGAAPQVLRRWLQRTVQGSAAGSQVLLVIDTRDWLTSVCHDLVDLGSHP